MIPVDQWLQQLEARLAALPPERRNEIVAEAREHLEALLAARRADGMSEAAAWESARIAFGDAELVGGELEREWQRAPRFETVGTPLSAEKKRRKIAESLTIVLPVPMFLLLIPLLQERGWLGLSLLLMAPWSYGSSLWRSRRQGAPSKPAAWEVISHALTPLIIAISGIKIQFGDELHGTLLGAALSDYFGHLLFAISLIGVPTCVALWRMQPQGNSDLPWRDTPDYSLNPIAAEEDYHFSLRLVLSTLIAIFAIPALWMAWQFSK